MIKEKINLLTSITLILLIGLVSGYVVGYFRATKNRFPEIKTIGEINAGITTIKLMEVKNGKLYGQIDGRRGRIAYSPENIIELEKDEGFEIPLNHIQLKSYYQTTDLPENTQYIASKNGKYYYSIFDKRAFNLSSKNRIYFQTDSEAKNKGYIKKE